MLRCILTHTVMLRYIFTHTVMLRWCIDIHSDVEMMYFQAVPLENPPESEQPMDMQETKVKTEGGENSS